MKEIKGNLWDFRGKDGYVLCITTNGTIKRDGTAVMGRGCALQAKNNYPGIAATLGRRLKYDGLKVVWLTTRLIAFPVKYEWHQKANLDLIKKSATELAREAANLRQNWFLLPRPGCGNGQRDWETEVKPIIENILPDNVLVISF